MVLDGAGTGGKQVDFIVSIGGIALVVTLAWWLNRARPRPPLDEDAAKRIAREGLAGFEPVAAALDANGNGAIVEGARGEAVLLKAQGIHWSVRSLPAGTRARAAGTDLIVRLPEIMFGETRLRLGEAEAARWAERITDL
jgi:hypothetical protein